MVFSELRALTSQN